MSSNRRDGDKVGQDVQSAQGTVANAIKALSSPMQLALFLLQAITKRYKQIQSLNNSIQGVTGEAISRQLGQKADQGAKINQRLTHSVPQRVMMNGKDTPKFLKTLKEAVVEKFEKGPLGETYRQAAQDKAAREAKQRGVLTPKPPTPGKEPPASPSHKM